MVLKVKVSGSYLRDNKPNDYSLTIYMPECDKDYIQMNAMRRAVPMALQLKGMMCDYLRSCYIDEIEEVSAGKDTPKAEADEIKAVESYKGKDIKTLSYEEIQNAAMAYQLIGVPLYHQTDIRESRQRFYYEYATNILGKELAKDFDFANALVIVLDEKKKARAEKSKSNTEILDGIESEKE